MENTKISIIMPSYNQGAYIERAILSVIDQNYDNVELLIFDAGSTDNTLDIIKKYDSFITFWRSYPDDGQSAAINEGFIKAKGTFLTWLNSDDVLLPGVLAELNKARGNNPSCRWFLGNVVWIDKNDYIIGTGKMPAWNGLLARKGYCDMGGPSCFIHKQLLQSHGMLREDFHYKMDTELKLRLLLCGEHFIRIKKYCWGLRFHENAKTSGQNFINSTLADKNHESWEKKDREDRILHDLYPMAYSFFWNKLYLISKLFDASIFSRIFDRKYLGEKHSESKNK